MCGRYALYGPVSRLREQFDPGFEEFDEKPRDFLDRYNIAPSQSAPVVHARGDGTRELISARWGLLPNWVKDPREFARPIIARSETAATSSMFRHAFGRSRGLVPASGFYEWKAGTRHKQPFFVRPVGGVELFGMGALLDHWSGPEGLVLTFAILTTLPNALIKPIHNRMPVIIRPENYGAWLDPALRDVDAVGELMEPYPSELMEAFPVGLAVGKSSAQGPDLVKPLA